MNNKLANCKVNYVKVSDDTMVEDANMNQKQIQGQGHQVDQNGLKNHRF